jgi:hypothetical protein
MYAPFVKTVSNSTGVTCRINTRGLNEFKVTATLEISVDKT